MARKIVSAIAVPCVGSVPVGVSVAGHGNLLEQEIGSAELPSDWTGVSIKPTMRLPESPGGFSVSETGPTGALAIGCGVRRRIENVIVIHGGDIADCLADWPSAASVAAASANCSR